MLSVIFTIICCLLFACIYILNDRLINLENRYHQLLHRVRDLEEEIFND